MKESIDDGETIPSKGGKEVQRERTQVQPKRTQTQRGIARGKGNKLCSRAPASGKKHIIKRQRRET